MHVKAEILNFLPYTVAYFAILHEHPPNCQISKEPLHVSVTLSYYLRLKLDPLLQLTYAMDIQFLSDVF